MADPIQARAKEKRLAEALRANLKRRKEQARERNAEGAQSVETNSASEDESAARRNEPSE